MTHATEKAIAKYLIESDELDRDELIRILSRPCRKCEGSFLPDMFQRGRRICLDCYREREKQRHIARGR